jgi:hypothetical protein
VGTVAGLEHEAGTGTALQPGLIFVGELLERFAQVGIGQGARKAPAALDLFPQALGFLDHLGIVTDFARSANQRALPCLGSTRTAAATRPLLLRLRRAFGLGQHAFHVVAGDGEADPDIARPGFVAGRAEQR